MLKVGCNRSKITNCLYRSLALLWLH